MLQDADSLDSNTGKKGEGNFYLWKASEIQEILRDNGAVFSEHYYVKPNGNCDLSALSDPHKEFTGKNCLIARQSIQDTAADMGCTEDEALAVLSRCRKLLHEQREQRPRPSRDDKVSALHADAVVLCIIDFWPSQNVSCSFAQLTDLEEF